MQVLGPYYFLCLNFTTFKKLSNLDSDFNGLYFSIRKFSLETSLVPQTDLANPILAFRSSPSTTLLLYQTSNTRSTHVNALEHLTQVKHTQIDCEFNKKPALKVSIKNQYSSFQQQSQLAKKSNNCHFSSHKVFLLFFLSLNSSLSATQKLQ